MEPRYQVRSGSESGHCCFEATVIDTKFPVIVNGRHLLNQYDIVAECFAVTDALLIATALNASPEALARVADND